MPARVACPCLILACAASPPAPPSTPHPPPPRPVLQRATAGGGLQIAATPPGPRDVLEVSGCNTQCVDCALDGRTYVLGRSSRGELRFPRIASDGRVVTPGELVPGGTHYYCDAKVAVGDSFTLEAHASPQFELAGWKGFSAADYCPCEGSTARTCEIEVTREVVSRYGRAYCGAIWRRRGAERAR